MSKPANQNDYLTDIKFNIDLCYVRSEIEKEFTVRFVTASVPLI